MNILLFTLEYNHSKTPNSGGIGTFVKMISSEFVKKGHKVYVFGFSETPVFFIDNSISVQLYNPNPSIFLDRILKKILSKKKYNVIINNIKRIYWTLLLNNFIKKKKIDIIEAYDYGGFFKYFNYLKKPFAIRSHGSLGLLKEYFGYDYIKNDIILLEKQAMKNAENIIAVSNYSKKITEEFYKKKNVEVIYNGVNTDLFKSSKKIVRDNQSIYYYGTISEKKGVETLVKVFNKIIEKYPDATLHLIGRGESYYNFLKENFFTAKALKATRYYGMVNHIDLPLLLNKAHLIVFATHGENFPFCFLEAMSMEKPVIVSNIKVASEIITHGHNGYIANSENEYVHFITQVFENNHEGMASNARKTVLENFSLSKMAESTLLYYKKIINEY